jgi:hypothetical protein
LLNKFYTFDNLQKIKIIRNQNNPKHCFWRLVALGALRTANPTKKRKISAVTVYSGQLGLLVLMVRNDKYEVEMRQRQ